MARSTIPFMQFQGGMVPVASPPLAAPASQPDPSAGVLERGLGRGVDLLVEVADRFVTARNSANVADAVTRSTTQLDEARADLDRDPDHAGRDAKFSARAKEIRDAQLAELGHPAAQQDYGRQFDRMAGSMGLQVRHQARQAENEAFKVKLEGNLDTISTQTVFARSPLERETLQKQAEDMIDDAVKTGRMTAAQANARKNEHLSRVDGALAAEMVRVAPGAAIGALGDPQKFTHLNASQRVQLRAQAQQRSESLGAQANAVLRADVHDANTQLERGAAGGPMPAKQEIDTLIKRAGPGSAMATMLQRNYDFYSQTNIAATANTIPQLAAKVGSLRSGVPTTHDSYPPAQSADGTVPAARAVTDPTLNEGRPTVIPSQWAGREVDAGEAIRRAVASGQSFPSFGTVQQADAAAAAASAELGRQLASPKAPSVADLRQAQVLEHALRAKVAERDADPAAYALKTNPSIAETFALATTQEKSEDALAQARAGETRQAAMVSILSAQIREGVRPDKIQLLTRSQAEIQRNDLENAVGMAGLNMIGEMKRLYGDQFDRAIGQIAGGKPLRPDLQFAAMLPADANENKLAIVDAYRMDEKQARELLGAAKYKEVDDAVLAAATPMHAAFVGAPGGEAWAATVQANIDKLARLYAVRGEDPVSAATHAAKTAFFDHYEMVGRLRVPKIKGQPIVPRADVELAQRTFLAALPKADLALPTGTPGMTEADRKAQLVAAMSSPSAFWIADKDEKGAIPYAGPGQPLRHGDGRLVVMPFEFMGEVASIERGAARRKLAGQAGAATPGIDPTVSPEAIEGLGRGPGGAPGVAAALRSALAAVERFLATPYDPRDFWLPKGALRDRFRRSMAVPQDDLSVILKRQLSPDK